MTNTLRFVCQISIILSCAQIRSALSCKRENFSENLVGLPSCLWNSVAHMGTDSTNYRSVVVMKIGDRVQWVGVQDPRAAPGYHGTIEKISYKDGNSIRVMWDETERYSWE